MVGCIFELEKLALLSMILAIVQVLSLLLAMILQSMGPRRRLDYDSDDDFVVIRRPLLNPQSGSNYTPTILHGNGYHQDIWSTQLRQKVPNCCVYIFLIVQLNFPSLQDQFSLSGIERLKYMLALLVWISGCGMVAHICWLWIGDVMVDVMVLSCG